MFSRGILAQHMERTVAEAKQQHPNTWIVLGPLSDVLGQKVPSEVVGDPARFAALGDRAVAQIGGKVYVCEYVPAGGHDQELTKSRLAAAMKTNLSMELE